MISIELTEVITIKTYYIENVDKPTIIRKMKKIKMERDNCEIYLDLNKEKNIRKVIDKMQKNEITNVVLEKELIKNKNFINALNSCEINIFDGRWLIKYLTFEILDYVVKNAEIKKEEIEIAITTNEITDLVVEVIRKFAKQYKKLTVVTNHIDKLRKIEKEIYNKEGIMIIVSNNPKKSLTKSKIILNIDFNKEVLNRYIINENAIIINLEGKMKIENKRFNGININDYEIEVGRKEVVWRENMKKFREKDLLEAKLYMKDTFNNIRSKIHKNKIEITELYRNKWKNRKIFLKCFSFCEKYNIILTV